jgi:hypothetical protein
MIPTRRVPCALAKERTGVWEDDDIGVSFLIKQGEWVTNTEMKCRFVSLSTTERSMAGHYMKCTNGLPFPGDLRA